MGKISISEQKLEQIKNVAREKAKKIAIEAREELTKEYLYTISQFYSEYEPVYYNRHFNNKYDEKSLMGSGMGKTFYKYYKNSHNNLYTGGIIITDETMYHDYSTSSVNVLNYFMNGYHGHPSLGIYSHINTYEHMLKYKNLLINELQRKYMK